MSAPTLANFSAELGKNNIARPNQYYVEILAPAALSSQDTRLVSMFCSAASTPHVFIMTNDNYIEAGVRRKYAYDIDFQNLVLNFYVDQKFEVKKFFDQWKNLTVPYHRRFNYPDSYTADSLFIYILDMTDEVTYKYEYTRVVPKTINSIELNYGNALQPAMLNVEFTFEDVYYTSMSGGSSKPGEVERINKNIRNNELTQTLNPKSRN